MEKDYQYDLTHEMIRGRKVIFTKGLGQANIHDPKQPRDFDAVAEQLFPALKTARMMNYGEGSKWDDRKYRLHLVDSVIPPGDPYSPNGCCFIRVGLTYFGASDADINRDIVVNRQLQECGEGIHQDKWAFFSRAIGAAFVPVTKDGHVFLGKRTGKLYHDWLNAAAGNVDYAGPPSFEHFQEQAVQELREEYGQRLEFIEEPRFVGIASHPLKGDADAVWVGRIDVLAEYFTSGRWREERKDAEHDPELVQIASTAERDRLLQEGKLDNREFPGIMYSTRLGLESLTGEDFRRE